MENSWLYQKHVRAEELVGIGRMINRILNRGVIAGLLALTALSVAIFLITETTWTTTGKTLRWLSLPLSALCALSIIEARDKLKRQREFHLEIEKDIRRLSELLGENSEQGGDSLQALLVKGSQQRREELQDLRMAPLDFLATPQRFSPGFKNKRFKPDVRTLEGVKTELEELQKLAMKFRLTEKT